MNKIAKNILVKRFNLLSLIRNLLVLERNNDLSIENELPEVSLSTSGSLSSFNLVVLLSASSNVIGAKYFWKGPQGFTSTQQNIFVMEPGLYMVTVFNPLNGYSNNASVNLVREPESLSGYYYPVHVRNI